MNGLCIAFHIAPEQEQGRMGYVHIFQVLTLVQVVYFNQVSSPGSRHSQCEYTLNVNYSELYAL